MGKGKKKVSNTRDRVRGIRAISCRYCGCTPGTPCATDQGLCHWVVRPNRNRRGVCSAGPCIKKWNADQGRTLFP